MSERGLRSSVIKAARLLCVRGTGLPTFPGPSEDPTVLATWQRSSRGSLRALLRELEVIRNRGPRCSQRSPSTRAAPARAESVIYPSPAPWRPWSNQAPGVKQARRRRFSPVKRFRRVRPRRPRSAGHLNDCRRSRLSKWPFLHIKQFRPGAVRSPNWQIGRGLLLITAFRAGPRWRGTAELIEIAGIIAAATLVSLCFGAIWSSMFRRNRCRRRSG